MLIPVFNVGEYVNDALNSILNQTYENLEIIVVDDGSSDDTFEKVQLISHSDHRLKLFRNPKNVKIVDTLNKAFSLSSGEYIARMDGDDISDPARLETKLRFLMGNPHIDMVGCSVRRIDSEGYVTGQATFYSNEKFIVEACKYTTPICHIWLARRSVYVLLNAYRNIPGAEDYDFCLRAISSGLRLTNIENYYGYDVRIGRVGNTSSQIGGRQRLLQKYVYELYLQRLSVGSDTFNEISMEASISQSLVSQLLFNISSWSLARLLNRRSVIDYTLSPFFAISIFLSPLHIRYLVSRIKYRLLKRNLGK